MKITNNFATNNQSIYSPNQNQINNTTFKGKISFGVKLHFIKDGFKDYDCFQLLDNIDKIVSNLDSYTEVVLERKGFLSSMSYPPALRVQNKSIGSSFIIKEINTVDQIEKKALLKERLRKADNKLFENASQGYSADIPRESTIPAVKRLQAFVKRTGINPDEKLPNELYPWSDFPYNGQPLSFKLRTLMYNIYTRLFNIYK